MKRTREFNSYGYWQGKRSLITDLVTVVPDDVPPFTQSGILTYDATTKIVSSTPGGGGGGAPTNAKYVLNQSDALLPNAQSLGSLPSGISTITTGTGLLNSVPFGPNHSVLSMVGSNPVFSTPSGGSIIWAPGQVNEAIQTWSDVIGVLTSSALPLTIFVDTSFGVATIPAGTWDMKYSSFDGRTYSTANAAIQLTSNGTLHNLKGLYNGAILTTNNTGGNSLTFSSSPSSAAFFEIAGTASLIANDIIPGVGPTASGEAFIFMVRQGANISGSGPFFNAGANSTTILIGVNEPNIAPNMFISVDNTASLILKRDGSGDMPFPSQTGFTGTIVESPVTPHWSGTTAAYPNDPLVGMEYFNTDIQTPVYWSGTAWINTVSSILWQPGGSLISSWTQVMDIVTNHNGPIDIYVDSTLGALNIPIGIYNMKYACFKAYLSGNNYSIVSMGDSTQLINLRGLYDGVVLRSTNTDVLTPALLFQSGTLATFEICNYSTLQIEGPVAPIFMSPSSTNCNAFILTVRYFSSILLLPGSLAILVDTGSRQVDIYTSNVAGISDDAVYSVDNSPTLRWFGDGTAPFPVPVTPNFTGTISVHPSSQPHGSTANRPDFPQIGFTMLDTSLQRPIWWNGTVWLDPTSGGGGGLPSMTNSNITQYLAVTYDPSGNAMLAWTDGPPHEFNDPTITTPLQQQLFAWDTTNSAAGGFNGAAAAGLEVTWRSFETVEDGTRTIRCNTGNFFMRQPLLPKSTLTLASKIGFFVKPLVNNETAAYIGWCIGQADGTANMAGGGAGAHPLLGISQEPGAWSAANMTIRSADGRQFLFSPAIQSVDSDLCFTYNLGTYTLEIYSDGILVFAMTESTFASPFYNLSNEMAISSKKGSLIIANDNPGSNYAFLTMRGLRSWSNALHLLSTPAWASVKSAITSGMTHWMY